MVSFSKPVAFAAVAFMVAAANAHMIMKTPTPYGKSTLNNSPLNADGSDFPCKQRPGVYDLEGASNTAIIGEPQLLSFTGSATHSGGSCQIALTTDLQPSPQSKWMVIKSIEGGCPDPVKGNAGDDPNFTGTPTFNFTVPAGIEPGQYTLAWTWFNKSGNREFYNNCAPLTVVAAKKKRYAPAPKVSKRQTSFPDIFKANIGNGCATVEDFDYHFPNPGAEVQENGIGPYMMLTCGISTNSTSAQTPTGTIDGAAGSAAATASTTATDGATSAAASGFASGNSGQYSQASDNDGQYSTASAASSVTASSAAASSAANPDQVVPVTTSAGESYSPVTASLTAAGYPYTNATATQAPAGPSPAAAATGFAPAPAAVSGTTPAAAAASNAPSTGSAEGTLSGPCSDEGEWNCIGGSSFQRCASGSWSAVIPLEAGVACTPGESSDFTMTAAQKAKAKRWVA